MQVVVAPDSFGGTLSAPRAAAAIAEGWRRVRPDDTVTVVPMSDGGEGLLDVLEAGLAAGGTGGITELEVAGPHGQPVRARWLVQGATAVIESAEACGLGQLPPDRRDPLRTTTYGVGQLLDAARSSGLRHVVVGTGGSATVDGGAGMLTALGVRLLREDGNGLKVGGGELHQLRAAATGWLDARWADVTLEVWADVRTPLLDAPAAFGPQKGAGPEDVAVLRRGLESLADALERDLGVDPELRGAQRTGSAGGLAYGLAAGLGASLLDGAAQVAEAVGLDAVLEDADLVVVGEGSLDASSLQGKVVGHVVAAARARGVDVAGVVGRSRGQGAAGLELEEASPAGPGEDPAADVTRAAERLARRLG